MDRYGTHVAGVGRRIAIAGRDVRAIAAVLAAAVVITTPACFEGDAAHGLPCTQDLDCGLGDRCIEGFCGGPMGGSTSGTGGSSDGTSEGTTDIPASCGNGVVDAGEQCEPAVPGTPDAACDIDCTLPVCGDGLTNGYALNTAVGDGVSVEQCDEGEAGQVQDAATCDADCTEVVCGDGHHNATIEPCDDDNDVEVDACTNACQPTLLAENFDDGQLDGWTLVDYDLSSSNADTAPGWAVANGRAHSGGPPQSTTVDDQYAYPGITILRTPMLALPEASELPAGFRLELHFAHELYVDHCANFPRGDGGIVRAVQGGVPIVLTPMGAYPDTLVDYCGVPDHPSNPLAADGAAYSGMRSGAVSFDLSALQGGGVQLEFVFGYDCVQCVDDPDTARGWWIDDVVVAPFPAG